MPTSGTTTRRCSPTAGLDPEAPPATWDDLVSTCDALKEAGITPIGAGWQDGFLASWYGDYGFISQLVTQEDIDAFWDPSVPPEEKMGWTDPLIRTAFGYLDELDERRVLQRVGTRVGLRRHVRRVRRRAGGDDLHRRRESRRSTETADAIGVDNLGVFKMPTLPDSPYTSQPMDAGPNITFGIMEFSDNCRVAWEYIKFHYTDESQALLTGKAGPIRTSTACRPVDSEIPAEAQVLEWLDNPDNHGGFSPGVGGPTDPINRRLTAVAERRCHPRRDTRSTGGGTPPAGRPGGHGGVRGITCLQLTDGRYRHAAARSGGEAANPPAPPGDRRTAGSPASWGQRIAAFRRAAAESVFIWPMLLLVGGLMLFPTAHGDLSIVLRLESRLRQPVRRVRQLSLSL